MPWLDDYQVVYEAILRHIKDKGILVYHRVIKSGAAGYYNQLNGSITVSKEARGTIEGCYYLCHEKSHAEQHRYGEFNDFFTMDKVFSEEKLALVIAAEVDADKKAQKMLKSWGVNYTPASLTEEGLKQNIEFWKSYYFKKVT